MSRAHRSSEGVITSVTAQVQYDLVDSEVDRHITTRVESIEIPTNTTNARALESLNNKITCLEEG